MTPTNYSDRVLHAAGHLLREWRHVATEDHLTGDERLDTLAAFLRAILDHGGGTWTFPPLPPAEPPETVNLPLEDQPPVPGGTTAIRDGKYVREPRPPETT